ncbi:hypothetical protein TWF506_002400 [Arthrobotrys conoides]|uniref:Uncharacterized protein n=1 Tax=Arthrobotrys conoides TaxID=74498 RepID=A0AAN8N7C1_9PEZI
MSVLPKQANDYGVIYKRPIRVSPPLSTGSDKPALPEPMGPLAFYQKECELGMFDTLPGSNGWLGQPLGERDFQPGACLKIDDLRQGLGNKISAYAVTGYCECEFFDDDSCHIGLFSAFNRADLSLRSNGPHDNMIESVRCKKTDHIDNFVSGSIYFQGGSVRGPYNSGEKAFTTELNLEIKKEQLYTDCIPISGGFPIRYYRINGVTCDFFGGASCTDFKFTAGHGGKADKKYPTNSPEYLKSFKCYPPYGIMWYPRDDLKPGRV